MLRRFFHFRTRHQPLMVRLSYRYELRSALTFPLAASLAEGSFTGVVAAKYFAASPLLIALITAAPMFGNILAIVWSELSKERRKVPFVNLLQLGVVLTIAAASLTAYLPRQWGGWVFALLIILARLLASGIITIRSVIWRANYPRQLRGQIIGRITTVATAVLAASTFLGSWWLDRDPRAFVILYPSAAILGAIGIYQFSHVRVRNEGRSLRRGARQPIYAPRPEDLSHTDEANVLNYEPDSAPGRFRAFFANAWRVLREDKQFRTYQRYQFLSGFSFMMFSPALLYMVSKQMTDERREYLLATVVLQIVPLAVLLIATQLWAPLFDRLHITTFRVWQTATSLAAQVILFTGAMLDQLWIVTAAQVLMGASVAGGNLAWNLGHSDFAADDKAAASYMGVHVMLTGLRGCVAPFLGAWLYQLPFIGRYVFALSTLVCLAALLGFVSMSRDAPKRTLQTKKAGGTALASAN
jgi:hypothetical protein